MTRTPKIRCAIYTRKSSEEGLEQEFNSLDANALIWCDTAEWVTLSSSAASLKLRWRAAASNARSWFKGGRRRVMRRVG